MCCARATVCASCRVCPGRATRRGGKSKPRRGAALGGVMRVSALYTCLSLPRLDDAAAILREAGAARLLAVGRVCELALAGVLQLRGLGRQRHAELVERTHVETGRGHDGDGMGARD